MAQPLRVALDATPLSAQQGGIRRYTAELARALAALYGDDRYYLVSDQPFELLCVAPNLGRGLGPGTALDRRWWTVGLARELRRLEADLFHGTDFAVPYLRLRPAVMTIHDLSPWREGTAEFTSRRVRRRTPLQLRLGLATMVITPSQAVRREVIGHFGLAPERVAAVPLAASELFRPVEPSRRPRSYFLCLGSSNPRKNLAVVEAAWRELRNEFDAGLVMVGEAGFKDLSDEAMAALYSGALAFLYPSWYEGFGLPVLEAMRCGAMVIASKDPAITEVAGRGAVQVDAADVRGWIEAMKAALSSEHRQKWGERGRTRAAEFSWEQTARMTHDIYDEARRLFR